MKKFEVIPPLRSLNFTAGRFERVSLTGNSHPIVTGGSRVSHAPPRHTLREGFPAFLNLHGRLIQIERSKNEFPYFQCAKLILKYRSSSVESLSFTAWNWETWEFKSSSWSLLSLSNFAIDSSVAFFDCLDWYHK